MRINVLYFAQLKQSRGLAEESVETEAATVGALYQAIAEQHSLDLPIGQIRIARNEAFCPPDTPIEDGDTVAFMPPMSGG